jgi:hypothetical protein
VQSAASASRLIPHGMFLALDKSKLQNWKNFDPVLLDNAAQYDPGNTHDQEEAMTLATRIEVMAAFIVTANKNQRVFRKSWRNWQHQKQSIVKPLSPSAPQFDQDIG